MKRLLRVAVVLAVLLVPGFFARPTRGQGSPFQAGPAAAPAPAGNVAPGAPPVADCSGPGFFQGDGLPPTALIEIPFNNANLYPDGGWTLYPGEAGSFVPSMSAYSHINGLLPPAISARE